MKEKIQKLRRLLTERDLCAVVVEKQNNFSWLTGGRGFIGLASENACGSLVVTKEDVFLLANNIEADRLATEEIPFPVTKKVYPWHEDEKRAKLLNELTSGKYATDSSLAAEFFGLRIRLDEEEIQSFREYGKLAAEQLEEGMKNLNKGDSELALAGEISERLWSVGIEPTTLLIAFDERISRYRHPLPTQNRLETTAMGVICVRYKGLFLSATRLVNLGKISNELRKKHQAVCRVDAAAISQTVKGAAFSDVFSKVKEAYESTGFGDEWQYHHQGGLTGYMGRELRLLPQSDFIVEEQQAFAYNPTITGTKSEDTIVTRSKGNEIVTHTGKWEYITQEGIARPDILIL